MVQPFDAQRLELSGEAHPVLEGLSLFTGRPHRRSRAILGIHERSAGLAPGLADRPEATDLVRPVGPERGDGRRARRLFRPGLVSGREERGGLQGGDGERPRRLDPRRGDGEAPEADLRPPRRLRPGLVSRRGEDRFLLRPPRDAGDLPEARGRLRRRRAPARLGGVSAARGGLVGRRPLPRLQLPETPPGQGPLPAPHVLQGSRRSHLLPRNGGHGARGRDRAERKVDRVHVHGVRGGGCLRARPVARGQARAREMAGLTRRRSPASMAARRQGALLLQHGRHDGRPGEAGGPLSQRARPRPSASPSATRSDRSRSTASTSPATDSGS